MYKSVNGPDVPVGLEQSVGPNNPAVGSIRDLV